jgi:hypothetical protein
VISPRHRTSVVLAAWAVVLAVSLLPTILAREVIGGTLSADTSTAASIAVLAAALALTVAWPPGRALRPLLVLFLVLVATRWFVYTQLDRLPIFADRLADPSFGVSMLAEQSLNVLVTLVVIAVLFALKRDRRSFYLAVGDLSARAGPIRWLGVKPGATWRTFGPILAACITLGTLTFLVVSGTPSGDAVVRALPFLPVVLLAGALKRVHRGGDVQGLSPVGARGAGRHTPGVVDGRGVLRHRALLRDPVRGRRRGARLLPRVDPGALDGRDARHGVGVVHPLPAGRRDLLVPRHRRDHAGRLSRMCAPLSLCRDVGRRVPACRGAALVGSPT